MALKLFTFMLFCFPMILFSQKDLKFIGTDSYETNYYTSENEALQNKLFIGNDMFRFLNQEKLDTVLNIFFHFLEKDSLLEEKTYQKVNDFTLSIPIKVHDKKTLIKIASNWNKDYSISFTDLIYDLCKHLLSDDNVHYQHPEEPIFHQLFRNEYRNRYSEFSKTAQTSFAIVLKDNFDLNIKEQRSYFKRKYSFNKLNHTEVALVENNKNDIELSIPLVSKMSKPNNYFALNFISQILGDSLEIKYGVHQSVLLVKNLDKNNFDKKILIVNEKDFKQNLKNIINNLESSIDENNLFFFTKGDIEILNTIIDTFSFSSYQEFVHRINESNKILIVNQDSVMLQEMLLIKAGLGVFDKSFQMKSNSIEFKNPKDEKLIHQLYLLMTLNSNLNININGYALEEEYNKVSRSRIKEMIGKDKNLKTNFKLSKNTSLALMRSVSIFQALVDLGIEKQRIRCNGIIANNEGQGVKISIQK